MRDSNPRGREPNPLSNSAPARFRAFVDIHLSLRVGVATVDDNREWWQLRLMGVQEAGSGGDSDSLLSEPSAGEHCLRQAR